MNKIRDGPGMHVVMKMTDKLMTFSLQYYEICQYVWTICDEIICMANKIDKIDEITSPKSSVEIHEQNIQSVS